MFERDAAVSEAIDSEELRCSEGSCIADCTRRELLFIVCDRGSVLCSGHKASWTLAKTLIEIELWVDLALARFNTWEIQLDTPRAS